jgi:hypothetical protein
VRIRCVRLVSLLVGASFGIMAAFWAENDRISRKPQTDVSPTLPRDVNRPPKSDYAFETVARSLSGESVETDDVGFKAARTAFESHKSWEGRLRELDEILKKQRSTTTERKRAFSMLASFAKMVGFSNVDVTSSLSFVDRMEGAEVFLAEVLGPIYSSTPERFRAIFEGVGVNERKRLLSISLSAGIKLATLSSTLSDVDPSGKRDLAIFVLDQIQSKYPSRIGEFSKAFPYKDCEGLAARMVTALFNLEPNLLEGWLREIPLQDRIKVLDAGYANAVQGADTAGSFLQARGTFDGLNAQRLARAISCVGAIDLKAAIGLVDRVDPSFRDEILDEVYNQQGLLAARNGLDLQQFADSVPERYRFKALSKALLELSKKDPRLALSIAANVQDEQQRIQIESNLLKSRLYELPRDTVIQRLTQELNRSASSAVYQSTAQQFLNKELISRPNEAQAFIASVQMPKERVALIQSYSESMGRYAPEQAIKWLDTFPAAERDAGLSSLVPVLVHSPNLAFKVAAGIQDPTTRQDAAQKLQALLEIVPKVDVRKLMSESGFTQADIAALEAAEAKP